MLPIIANEIGTFSAEHGMRLNGPKCKDMLIDFLRYTPFPTAPIFINGLPIEQVSTNKILGVYVASDLSWGYHCGYIVKRARKRLYALRVLVKSGLSSQVVLQVYCSLVRSVLEYASPVWASLPDYLSYLIESVQREALRIILPNLSYDQALVRSGLQTLLERRGQACERFVQALSVSLLVFPPERSSVSHGYGLHSGTAWQSVNNNRLLRTDRFITFKYGNCYFCPCKFCNLLTDPSCNLANATKE